MGKRTILVVEDDADIQELIAYNLEREGYRVLRALSGEDGMRQAHAQLPDLILLDLMLPGTDGFGVCKALKQESRTRQIPIVMVTAKGEESDVVTGLELGADDYLSKPFRPRELVARVRAVLRRVQASVAEPDEAVVQMHEITIDPARREVRVGGKPVTLTFTEFQILHFLARNAGRVFTRYQIVDAVHGENYAVTDRAVDVQIVGLRRKLGKAARHIETVRGIGYRFCD